MNSSLNFSLHIIQLFNIGINMVLIIIWVAWHRTVFYGQYRCSGPGASFAGRVSWSRELTDEEAKPFISLSFIDGSEWVKI